MTTRRNFLGAAAAGLVATPFIARAAWAQTAPLEISVTASEFPIAEASINLPPLVEGDYTIPERFQARIVDVMPGLEVNSIHIVPQSYNLYFILPENKAIRYGVAVGQEGLGWRGSATIKRKVEWPSWRPTNEMIERNPAAYERYKDGMPGGPTNPLGARAIYFFQGDRDTAIRVHGTTQPSSIGKSASNGCFRMYNSHVIDLYNRVPLGASAYAY